MTPNNRAQSVDLHSLLATTAARQAVTPTARVQARLMADDGAENSVILDEKISQVYISDQKSSQNFNYLASKILRERWR